MYNASKAALYSMSDTLLVELSPFDVKVTTVSFNFGSVVVDCDREI
jgi:NAD(P)-dependent dehydrogenase (short-subunit alcohol dehydrogenase family)